MQTAFTKIGEGRPTSQKQERRKTDLTKIGEEGKTDLTETGEEEDRLHRNRGEEGRPTKQKEERRKTDFTKIGEEDRLHKNRRGEETALTKIGEGKTDLTETGDRRGDWRVGEK